MVEDRGASVTPRFKLTLTYRNLREVYEGNTVGAIAALITAESTLVNVGTVSNSGAALTPVATPDPFEDGNDQAAVTSVDLNRGLSALEDQTINILLVAGAGSNEVRGIVTGYLERTENEGREQIAILGASASGTKTAASAVANEAAALNDDRIVLVAPGLKSVDAASGRTVSLPPPYLAAVIAGKMSTLAPHVSLTNKTLAVDDLDVHYSAPLYKSLLLSRVLLVRKKFGFQVVKGISSDNGAFKQISVRRIVDYAKAGVRSGSDPYIGRLNNARVRAALKATLDGFLSQMVLDEMLVGYELDVTATRAQEIQGICSVVMTLLPTFSIDYIRVTMNLK
jgi:hypothetical protein